MSLVGKSVYHIHDVNKIQFGNVIDEKLEKTWKWVKVNWLNGTPTNIYNSPSFDTISAFGLHSALPHYRVTKESNLFFNYGWVFPFYDY